MTPDQARAVLSEEELTEIRCRALADKGPWAATTVRRLLATIDAKSTAVLSLLNELEGYKALLNDANHKALMERLLDVEAANESLGAERDQLRGALKPFGKYFQPFHRQLSDETVAFGLDILEITVGELRMAFEALSTPIPAATGEPSLASKTYPDGIDRRTPGTIEVCENCGDAMPIEFCEHPSDFTGERWLSPCAFPLRPKQVSP